MLLFQEQVFEAAGSLRGDPLLYVLVMVLLAGIGGMFMLYMRERKTNNDLSKVVADALSSLIQVVSNIEKNQTRLEGRYDATVSRIDENLKSHINALLAGLKFKSGGDL